MRKGEDKAVKAVKQAWSAVEAGIQVKQAALIADMAAAEAAGEGITVSWLLLSARYDALLRQIRDSGKTLGETAGNGVGEAQRSVAAAAGKAAEKLTYAAAGVSSARQAVKAGITWNALPDTALEALVGFAGDGSPLATLFTQIARDRADQVRDTLLAGVGRGAASREIAADLEAITTASRNRAYTIARTETNRAHRQAALDTYAANSRIVEGWTWVCVCDKRSCLACWAMHGTVHPLTETFGSHPSCRCSAVPKLRDLRTDPSQPDLRPVIPTGAARLAGLSTEDRAAVLGPTFAPQYEAGTLTLSDLVHTRHDVRWGTTRTAATIAQAAQNTAARRRTAAFPSLPGL